MQITVWNVQISVVLPCCLLRAQELSLWDSIFKSIAEGPKEKYLNFLSSTQLLKREEEKEKSPSGARKTMETKENERDLPEMRLEEHVQVET